jgi:probable rRNA maturation factor
MSPRKRRHSGAGLHVSVTDAVGRPIGRGTGVRLGAWLRKAAPAGARGAVTIAIVGDQAMRRLNRQYRGKDYATDVLSFPGVDAPGLHDDSAPSAHGGRNYASGDIAIARGVAARQAREAGHAVSAEIRLLALHGLLHLLGYDHETDRGEMARVENQLRRRAGLPAGLIARVARPGRSRRA